MFAAGFHVAWIAAIGRMSRKFLETCPKPPLARHSFAPRNNQEGNLRLYSPDYFWSDSFLKPIGIDCEVEMKKTTKICIAAFAAPMFLAGCIGGSTGGGSSSIASMAATSPIQSTTTNGVTKTVYPATINTNATYQTNAVNDASFATLINGVRTANGVSSVTYNAQLDQAAQAHSEDMLANDYFSHTGLNGSTVGARVSAAGYNWKRVGENIAQGQTSESQVLDDWVASSGHQANNINPYFTEFGLGRAGTGSQTRWTLVFAEPMP